jgi:NAD(P)H-hydrate epimerase
MRVFGAMEMRAIDRATIERFGIPGIVLMEHAAAAVVGAAEERLLPGGRAVVLAGGGNNGGDGWAAARLLMLAGVPVTVLHLVPPERLAGDAAVNARAFAALGGDARPWPEAGAPVPPAGAGDVVIDALLGTGLDRAPAGAFAAAIEAVNEARSRGAAVVAVDVPSGLAADTGRPPGACVRADVTVTFGYPKLGLVLEPGASLAGELRVADISLAPAAVDGLGPPTFLLEEDEVRALLPPREAGGHKGTYGHLLALAGSPGKTGAAALLASGALRAGVGLCTVAARPDALPAVQAHVPEAMGSALPPGGALSPADVPAVLAALAGKDALAAGPGLPRGPATPAFFAALLPALPVPAVLDADALNAVAEAPDALGRAARPVVVTPHPGEMARLAGISIALVQADRIGVARRFAAAHRCTVVLKGARTVIADPDGTVAVNPTGNPGMATGGSGDVLTGVVGALLAAGLPPAAAARVAVFAHGKAGDLRAAAVGQAGLVASDLAAGLGEVWAGWGR